MDRGVILAIIFGGIIKLAALELNIATVDAIMLVVGVPIVAVVMLDTIVPETVTKLHVIRDIIALEEIQLKYQYLSVSHIHYAWRSPDTESFLFVLKGNTKTVIMGRPIMIVQQVRQISPR